LPVRILIVSLITIVLDTDPLPAVEALSNLINGLASMPLLAIPAMDASQIVALAIAILALIVSGFVSGSEIAFFSLTPVQYDQLEEEGDRGERVLSLV